MADEEVYGLSERDVQILKDWIRNGRGYNSWDYDPREVGQSADHYIAKLPAAGRYIPACNLDTGVPGKADCNIFKINVGGSLNPGSTTGTIYQSEEIVGMNRVSDGNPLVVPVFNIYPIPMMYEGGYFLVTRLKTGGFVCDKPHSGVIGKVVSPISAAIDDTTGSNVGDRTAGQGRVDVYIRSRVAFGYTAVNVFIITTLTNQIIWNTTTQTEVNGNFVQGKWDFTGDLLWDVADCPT